MVEPRGIKILGVQRGGPLRLRDHGPYPEHHRRVGLVRLVGEHELQPQPRGPGWHTLQSSVDLALSPLLLGSNERVAPQSKLERILTVQDKLLPRHRAIRRQ
eukprot:6384979-Prorocentrum_lima.AAC.2